MVTIGHAGPPRPWSPEDEQFVASVADCVSLVLESHRRRQAEELRARIEADLRQTQRMDSIGMVAGGIAHDFNNLLVPILGNADIALEMVERGPVDPELLVDIRDAAMSARELVAQLLAFSRKQVLHFKVLDLNDEVRKLGRLITCALPENITLRLALCNRALPLRADAGQLQQVLLNLVVNARDAMPDGGSIRIASGTVADGGVDHVVLSIEDDGCGMDDETRARVFEPFYTTKALGRGTGLGLSTVYGIVQQHGGTISVTSDVGRGTRFEVRLPASNTACVDVTTGSIPRYTGALGGETILVVEDEPMVRGVVRRLLSGQGYRVIDTGVPDDAIVMAREHPEIALVITDVIMPGMNGREMYQRIAADRPDTKVMYMSGYDNDVLAPHGIDDGVERIALLRKPFAAHELLQSVKRAIRVRGPSRASVAPIGPAPG
jgi:nitrogen-specific signal transduction histidine kinase/CheY-like chemotaxis protein